MKFIDNILDSKNDFLTTSKMKITLKINFVVNFIFFKVKIVVHSDFDRSYLSVHKFQDLKEVQVFLLKQIFFSKFKKYLSLFFQTIK